MFTVRKKDGRGTTGADWLVSKHSFSFSNYYDAAHMGFGPLRVINEDWVDPASGFDTHGHKNMEIITYVLEGELAHKDSAGPAGSRPGAGAPAVIRPGEVQMMSAGKGILHSEFNNSPSDPVHLLQIWIMPDVTGTQPGYQQKPFPAEEMQNRFRLLVSKDGRKGSLTIRQDAALSAAKVDAGKALHFPVEKDRLYWLQVARGSVNLQDQPLEAGDGLAITKEAGILEVKAGSDAEVLLFDLPQ